MNHYQKNKQLFATGRVAICNPVIFDNQQSRGRFDAFHRYIFALNDSMIYRLSDACKKANTEALKEFPADKFTDLSLLFDAIQYQIALRDDQQATPAIAEEIAINWHDNVNIAEQFDEINSEHLIKQCKQWLSD